MRVSRGTIARTTAARSGSESGPFLIFSDGNDRVRSRVQVVDEAAIIAGPRDEQAEPESLDGGRGVKGRFVDVAGGFRLDQHGWGLPGTRVQVVEEEQFASVGGAADGNVSRKCLKARPDKSSDWYEICLILG